MNRTVGITLPARSNAVANKPLRSPTLTVTVGGAVVAAPPPCGPPAARGPPPAPARGRARGGGAPTGVTKAAGKVKPPPQGNREEEMRCPNKTSPGRASERPREGGSECPRH